MNAAPPYRHCFTEPYNQGHFEGGVWIPDCKRCGKCCEGFWLNADKEEDYIKFDLLHRGTEKIGGVIYVRAPCKHLKTVFDPEIVGGKLQSIGALKVCELHEQDRPACCKRFGFGNYFHPPECAFFGGETDTELNLQVVQERGE